MIDLGKEKAYEIKLINGDILRCKFPTDELLDKLLAIKTDSVQKSFVAKRLYRLALDIFNRNYNGMIFTMEDIKQQMDIATCGLVLRDYVCHVTDSLKN